MGTLARLEARGAREVIFILTLNLFWRLNIIVCVRATEAVQYADGFARSAREEGTLQLSMLLYTWAYLYLVFESLQDQSIGLVCLPICPRTALHNCQL